MSAAVISKSERAGAPAFTAASAEDYDERIVRLVPGYPLAIELIATLMATLLDDDAHVLVIGTGTGADFLALAAMGPRWRFMAIDLSAPMLDRAREKAERAGIADRVEFATTTMQDFQPGHDFDAAVSVMVSHFTPDDGRRLDFYRAVSRSLRAGAPYLTVDTAASADPDTINDAVERWLTNHDFTAAEAVTSRKRVAAGHHGISPERLAALFDEAGFAPPLPFFRALRVEGFVTRRRE